MTTILIVEDESDLRALLHLQLELDGYTVVGCETAERGLEILRGRPVDLVLLDAGLPGMTGYEMLRAVVHEPGLTDVPVIMLTGSRGIEDVAHAFRLGAQDHLAKPFRSQDLRARIAAALDRRAAAAGASA